MYNPTLTDYLDFMAQPSAYAEPTATVAIRQTHISIVAITDHYVYKLKKPVRFNFLDFTTPKRRLFYCKEEIRLNQRLSPDLYVALLPLYYHQGKLQFRAEGRIVNYVIQMHRLSEAGLLVNQIQLPDFSTANLNLLATTLIRFYQKLTPRAGISQFGSVRYIRRTIREVTEGFGQLQTLEIPSRAANVLGHYLSGFLKNCSPVFRQRVESNRIVEGHGDLRCEHIHIENGVVTIYDCLEFALRLRSVDWLNDLAFLLMDLEHRRCYHHARYLERVMLDALETTNVRALLTFYKTYRACVRGKVNGLKAAETEVPEADREASRQKARQYYQLAMRYALLGSEPTVLVCLGTVASGKTTLAETLESWMGILVLSSDTLRKQLAGLNPFTRLPDTERALLYTPVMTEHVYKKLEEQALAEVKQTGAAVIDATYRQPHYLRAVAEKCRRLGIRLLTILVTASEELILQRLAARENQPVVSDMRLADYNADTCRMSYAVTNVVESVLKVDTALPPDLVMEQRIIPWLIRMSRLKS